MPPEQVIGTEPEDQIRAQGRPVPSLIYLPELAASTTAPANPRTSPSHIGRAPLIAVGNSDGDQQMLEYSAASAAAQPAGACPSRRCRAGIRLRPRLEDRHARQGARRGPRPRLDRGQHEDRLEDDLPAAIAQIRSLGPPAPPWGFTRCPSQRAANRLSRTIFVRSRAMPKGKPNILVIWGDDIGISRTSAATPTA